MSEATTAPPPTDGVAPPESSLPVSPTEGSGEVQTTGAPALSDSLLTDKPAAEQPAEPPKEGEQQPEGEKPAEPVAYEPFTLPEGLDAADPTLAAFQDTASRLGLTQEQAQTIVSEIGAKVAEGAQAQIKAWTDLNNTWQDQVKSDPDIGGRKLTETLTGIGRLFDDFVGTEGTPERKALNEALLLTGAGNHPAVVRAFARLASILNEPGFVRGGPSTTADPLASMYPSTAAKG